MNVRRNRNVVIGKPHSYLAVTYFFLKKSHITLIANRTTSGKKTSGKKDRIIEVCSITYFFPKMSRPQCQRAATRPMPIRVKVNNMITL
jgi:hypothetical protein